MDHESGYKKFLFRKHKSMIDFNLDHPAEVIGEDERQTNSYPGTPKGGFSKRKNSSNTFTL